MHLRRALLLFAIVLGLAAVAAAISQPTSTDDDQPPPTSREQSVPTVGAGDASPEAAEVAFDATKPRARGIDVEQPAVVTVAADSPGLVEIPTLGLSAPADPLTPARFDVLEPEPGRHRIRFTPAGADEPRRAGTLVVRAGET